MILKLLWIKWYIQKTYFWRYFWINIIFEIIFCHYFEFPPLPDSEKFDHPLKIPPLPLSPLPLKIPKFLSCPQSRVGKTLWAHHSENVVYDLGTYTANIVNFTWFLKLILGLDASTFRRVKGACSVISFKGTCTLKWDAPLSRGIRYVQNLFVFGDG